MKIKPLLLIIVLILITSCSQKNSFSKIETKYLDRDYLIHNIEPNNEILYWKYVESAPKRIIKESGNRRLLNRYEISEPGTGFFIECFPEFCYSYIVFIDKNGLNYVTNDSSLLRFIGEIDNISEAILVGKTQGLWVDHENEKGGSYRKTNTGFEFKLGQDNCCPLSHESIIFEINFNGEFTTKSNGIYRWPTDNIIF
jgi:hypothetical protein